MTLQERISADMKEAMKAKDKVRLAALRDIKSKIMLALTETGGADSLDDAAVTKILSKQLKQREDTLAIYKSKAGKTSLQKSWNKPTSSGSTCPNR